MSSIDLSADWIVSGDRSHPNLKLVDRLRCTSTYDGYEDDIHELERSHLNGDTYTFENTLFKIREREKMSDGDRSHPRLVQLDALLWKLSYDCWEDDFEEAEEVHYNSEQDSFEHCITKLERKQAIHEDDRSHRDLGYLDSLYLTHPHWEEDFEEAVDNHVNGWFDKSDKFRLEEKHGCIEGTDLTRDLLHLIHWRCHIMIGKMMLKMWKRIIWGSFPRTQV